MKTLIDTQRTIRSFNSDLWGARNIKIGYYLRRHIEPYIRKAEEEEANASTAIANAAEVVKKITATNVEKVDIMEGIFGHKKGMLFLNKLDPTRAEVKLNDAKPGITFEPSSKSPMQFTPFRLSLRVKKNDLKSIASLLKPLDPKTATNAEIKPILDKIAHDYNGQGIAIS